MNIAQYWKEILIVVMVVALCFATLQCDRNKGKLNNIDAANVRHSQISSAQAGRSEVKTREAILYPAIDKASREIANQRTIIRNTENSLPQIQKENIRNDIQANEQGDIHRLADMFRAAGYPCTVTSR